MTTLTKEQSDLYLSQLRGVQDGIQKIAASRNVSLPTVVPPAPETIKPTAPLMGATPVSNNKVTTPAVPSTPSMPKIEPTYSKADSVKLAKQYGLQGMADNAFVGLTAEKAGALAARMKGERSAQVSPNTSYSFNPDTLSRTDKAISRLSGALDNVINTPFLGKQSKNSQVTSLVDGTTRELAQVFQTPEEFQQVYSTNPTFKASIDRFTQMGGSIDKVIAQIKPSMTIGPVGNQTTADYLANINNPSANPQAQKQAMDELAPERALMQDEIARMNAIPKEKMSLYFGDKNTMGILREKQNQALEEKRILDERAKDEQASLKARANIEIQKTEADARLQKAKIEENRLVAKNYITGMLSKLGALNTTGAAVVAIQTLDTKYNLAAMEQENQLKYSTDLIRTKLTTELNTLENDTDEKILRIQQDLTKDTETIYKEIAKVQEEADKQFYTTSLHYATKLRERTNTYTAAIKKSAEEYAKKYARIAANGVDLSSFKEGDYVPKKGVLMPNGTYTNLNLTPMQLQDVQASGAVGLTDIRYLINLPSVVRDKVVREASATGNRVTMATMQKALTDYENSKKSKETKLIDSINQW